MKILRLNQAVVAACLPLFAMTFYLHADAPAGKGLIHPTKEEHAKIHSRRASHVLPNKIGAARVHLHHEKMGMAPPTMTVAKAGAAEFVMQAAAPTQTTVFPSSVNNSLLPSFPPIGNQQELGSCVAWGTTYYLATHEYGLLNGINNKTSTAHILSPKWTYNLLNGGQDGGLNLTDPFVLLQQNGACPLSIFPYDHNFTAWDVNTQDWIAAMSYRMQPYVALDGLNTAPQNLTKIKQALVNGHVLVLGSCIDSWAFSRIQSNPQTKNHAVGELACFWMNGYEGGHCMTVVGYDDDIWIDVNGNGQVDPGEMGAFLIANSWGTHWGNKGFVWVSYDAFLTTSNVPNGPSAGRVPVAALTNSTLLTTVPKAPHYQPSLVAEFNITQTERNQIKITCGSSDTSRQTPSHYFMSGALVYAGGALGYSGTSSSMPQSGTFPLDLSDLVSTSNQRYYLIVCDDAKTVPTTINGLSLVNLQSGQTVQGIQMPIQVDNSKVTKMIDYTFTTATQARPLDLKISSISKVEDLDGVITISVQPSHAINRVEFYIDSTLQAVDDSAPYLTHVDTKKLTNGIHMVSFIAYDKWNQSAKSSTSIKVNN